MEQNLPIIAKKFWKIVRVAYFMLIKGISKGKILADLNFMLKRGKIAGKLEAIHNLMFHHHHNSSSSSSSASRRSNERYQLSFPAPLNEYEFSCSNSPAYPAFHLPFPLNYNKRKNSHAPAPIDRDLMMAAMEIINSTAAASPALPGFGPSPMVRKLRVTDSPYPLKDFEEDNHVDEAADEFIAKFYQELRRQNAMNYLGY